MESGTVPFLHSLIRYGLTPRRRARAFQVSPVSSLKGSSLSGKSRGNVNGGGMLGHWGGVKLYHLVCKASEKVRANWPA